jgi:hypothetical protein
MVKKIKENKGNETSIISTIMKTGMAFSSLSFSKVFHISREEFIKEPDDDDGELEVEDGEVYPAT